MSKVSNVIKAYVKVMLRHEGGYVDDPSDPGGETYCGISREHHPDWKGWEKLDKEDRPININSFFPNMDNDVIDFYMKNYVTSDMNVEEVAKLNVNLGMQLFDFGVNAGVSRSAKLLQRIVKVGQDGQVGPKTIAAIAAMGSDEVAARFVRGRISYYKSLASRHTWAHKFLRVWNKRVTENARSLAEALA